MIKLWTTTLVLALASVSAGCKSQDAAGTSGSAAADPAQAAESEADKDGETAEKLSAYIDCLNKLTPEARESREWYLRNIDPVKGPTGKETYGGIKDIRPDSCFKGLDAAKALKPALPEVEAAAETYRKAAADLLTLIKPADEYYTQNNYKDDQWAKAKAMHPGLMAAYEAFFTANSALSGKVKGINEDLAKRHLERLAKDPKRQLEFLTAKAIADAKVVVNLADVEKFADLDGDVYNKAVEAFVASLKAVETYRDAHMDEAVNHANFLGYGGQLIVAAKEEGRAKRDGKMPAESSSQGHPGYTIDKFNAFIGVANDLTYKN